MRDKGSDPALKVRRITKQFGGFFMGNYAKVKAEVVKEIPVSLGVKM